MCSCTSDDITAATDDHTSALIFQGGHQGHMIDEVDIHEVRDFRFRKAVLR